MAKTPRLPPKKPPPRRGRSGELAEVPLDRLVSALAEEDAAADAPVPEDRSEETGSVLAREGSEPGAHPPRDPPGLAVEAKGGEVVDAEDAGSVAEGRAAPSTDVDATGVAAEIDVGGVAADLDDDAAADLEVTETDASVAEEIEVGRATADLDADADEETPHDPPEPPVAFDLEEDPDEDVEARRAAAAAAGVTLADAIVSDPEDDLREVEGEASPRLCSIIESLIFAAPKPISVADLRRLLEESSKRQIQLALKHLIETTKDRGVAVVQVAGGFQMRTHHDNAPWVQRLLQAKPVRLSRSQLETLAIVAYRQPVTRPEVDDVRGVDSGAVLKALLERELIQIVGKKDEPGRPLLYGTTHKFLEFFNLRSLRDLPTLRDFRELSEESKATLRRRYGEAEAEALGQEVIAFSGGDAPEGEAAPEAAGEDTATALDSATDTEAEVDTTSEAPDGEATGQGSGVVDEAAPRRDDARGHGDVEAAGEEVADTEASREDTRDPDRDTAPVAAPEESGSEDDATSGAEDDEDDESAEPDTEDDETSGDDDDEKSGDDDDDEKSDSEGDETSGDDGDEKSDSEGDEESGDEDDESEEADSADDEESGDEDDEGSNHEDDEDSEDDEASDAEDEDSESEDDEVPSDEGDEDPEEPDDEASDDEDTEESDSEDTTHEDDTDPDDDRYEVVYEVVYDEDRPDDDEVVDAADPDHGDAPPNPRAPGERPDGDPDDNP